MKEELSLESPYKIFFEDEEYFFNTNSGIKYILYFKDVNYFGISYLDKNISEFIFNPETGKGRNDKNIRLTVFSIIKSFFSKNTDNVLFYIADNSDNKHKARKRLFNKWFKENNLKLEKFDFQLKDGDIIYYGSLILSENNTYYSEYKSEINKTLMAFKNAK
ncbi:MAG: DUF6169 family protein [Bacteroidales bacterium]|nr:DUF6169 family protein [Bacteroidales bacterium]